MVKGDCDLWAAIAKGVFVFILYTASIFSRLILGSYDEPFAKYNFTILQNASWNAPTWADTIRSGVVNNAEFIAKGKVIYFRQCVVCHGTNGKGDGESGFGLDVPPGDLTDERTVSESDGAIFWKITTGREPMPQFNYNLTEKERWQIVAWLRFMQQNPPAKTKLKKK